ncbi:MAG: hypothetical protein K8R68_09220 [Bacteroidales bacterium]|nr:hypothetical protein [Bacteroidales bacterium]
MNKDGSFKKYDLIHFKNGYHKIAPTMIIEMKNVIIAKERGKFYFKKRNYFEIKLGEIISVSNVI